MGAPALNRVEDAASDYGSDLGIPRSYLGPYRFRLWLHMLDGQDEGNIASVEWTVPSFQSHQRLMMELDAGDLGPYHTSDYEPLPTWIVAWPTR